MDVDRVPLILVGIDGSDTSMRAGAFAASLARRQQGRVICLFVHTVGGLAAAAPGAVPAMADTNRDLAEQLRDEVAAGGAWVGMQTEFLERSGNPFRELVKVADERKVDSVVVGASMQAGHKLVGSLAVHLVREARWPVTVVP